MESYEVLQDPLGDRKVKDLPLPPIKPLSDE
jgi:serine/threonine-protein phosphatase 2B catalytic subunit